MNKSRLIKAIADSESITFQDEDGGHMIVFEGQVCTPVFLTQGAAEICLDMYRNGTRKPELPDRTWHLVADALSDLDKDNGVQ